MTLEKFTLSTLATMDDGRIKEAFEQSIKRCESDCKDRPGLDGERKVVLDVTLTPVPDENGVLDSVDIQFKIKDTLPKRCSKTYNMRATRGGLLFNEISPDDVNQATLEFDPKPTKAEVTDAG